MQNHLFISNILIGMYGIGLKPDAFAFLNFKLVTIGTNFNFPRKDRDKFGCSL